MNNCPALLLCDFYKTVHSEQYPKNMTKIVSYFTPRMSRVEDTHLVMFGLQAFIKQYLIEYFNENFFNKPKDEVLADYNRILTYTLGEGSYESEKVANLYDLGYLPIEIRAIPEGTLVPVKVPMIEISNTHPQFAWIVNAIETIMSCSLWHPMISANVGYKYRQIVDKYYDKTVDDNIPHARALGDFSMRGQESLESATKSSAAFCLSFLNTATVPAIPFLEKYYNCDCTKEPVAYGAISTEHSVMCSNYALDGSEETMIKRLLNEIYPNQSFSMVSDSYDYWNLVDNILPKCYGDIIKHKDAYVIVKSGTENGCITAVDPFKSEEINIIPTKSMFGFNFVTKVINVFGNMFGENTVTPSEDNPFGNITPFIMMSAMSNDNNDNDGIMKMLLMSQMMNGQSGMDFSKNPMLMFMLAKNM